MVPKNHKVKTAAIGPSGLNFTLYINEEFWSSLDEKTATKVVLHECLHLCLKHVTDLFTADNHYNMNLATDAVVNSICGLTEKDGAITVDKLSQEIGEKLEYNRGSWYYYNKIQDFAKKNPDKCNANGNLKINKGSDHDQWPEGLSEAEQTLLENQLNSQIKEAAEQTIKQAGTIPGCMSDIIKALQYKEPVFNWKSYFKRIIGNSISSDLRLTKLRPSKRFPDSRGTLLKRKANICVIVDTSGSVNNTELSEFFGEIKHILKSGVNITVVECDSEIQKIFKYTGKENITIAGRGGTILTEAFNYYTQHKEFSSCVVFTDGYLCDKEIPPMRNIIWVITSNGNKSLRAPGKFIFIPVINTK